MDKERRYGQMVPVMREAGRITEHMALESSHISMAMYMKVIGSTIKPMDKVSTSMLMEHATKGSGWMICNTDSARSNGPMALSMRDNTWPERNMAEAITAGMMARGTLANGRKTK